jgi:hypothetical protein
MTWRLGTIKEYFPPWDADRPYPALVNDGVSLVYAGESNGRSIFLYKSSDVDFSFRATRYLVEGSLTDTWRIDFGTLRRVLIAGHGESFVREHIETLKRNIKEALLTDPAWPADFGHPELPARNVSFDKCGNPGIGRFAHERTRHAQSRLPELSRRAPCHWRHALSPPSRLSVC